VTFLTGPPGAALLRELSRMCISAVTNLRASLFVDTPLVSVDFDGQVVLEWVAGPRRLSVFATDDAITYVKSWGTNIHSDMEDGALASDEELRDLLRWLDG